MTSVDQARHDRQHGVKSAGTSGRSFEHRFRHVYVMFSCGSSMPKGSRGAQARISKKIVRQEARIFNVLALHGETAVMKI
jgi:hypothetical protein